MKNVLRIEKHQSNAQLGAVNAHCARKMNVPNAVPELHKYNERPIGTDNLVQDVKNRLEEADIKTVRKNGVRAIQYVITASPEFFNKTHRPGEGLEYDKQRTDEFFRVAQKWLKETYGDSNLVNFTIHMDEKTPHAHAFVVPITKEGKLSARHFTGGSDGWKKLKEQQTTFAQATAHLGLDRGDESRKAKHQTVKEFYGKIDIAEQILSEPTNLPDNVTYQVKKFKAPERANEGFLGREKESEWIARIEEKAQEHTRKAIEQNILLVSETYQEAVQMLEVKSVKAAQISAEGNSQRIKINRLEKGIEKLNEEQKSLKEERKISENKLKVEVQNLQSENNSLRRQLAGVKNNMQKEIDQLKFNIKSYLKMLSERVKTELLMFTRYKNKSFRPSEIEEEFRESEMRINKVNKWIQEEGINIGKNRGIG